MDRNNDILSPLDNHPTHSGLAPSSQTFETTELAVQWAMEEKEAREVGGRPA
jgi:hypothetical protein